MASLITLYFLPESEINLLHTESNNNIPFLIESTNLIESLQTSTKYINSPRELTFSCVSDLYDLNAELYSKQTHLSTTAKTFSPNDLKYTPNTYGSVRYESVDAMIEDNIFNLSFGFQHGDSLRTPIEPINYTNIVKIEGEDVDISKLPRKDIVNLFIECDNVDEIAQTQHVQSLYQASVPTVKLYYPEPFIASPSFIHQDLGFLHILHYVF